MHWLYMLASLVSLGLAMVRSMPTLGVLFFLACALGLMIAGLLGWVSSRIASQTRDIGHIMGPDELRRMREQADRNKAARAQNDGNPQ